MSFIIMLLSLFCLTCKEKELNNSPISHNEIGISISKTYFEEVAYLKKEKVNQKDIFEYKDFKILIEYGSNSLIGFSQENKSNYYKFNYDLDSGELDLLRFKGKDGDLFIVELDDYYARFYNIYYETKENVYYLGNVDTDLSKIIEDNPKLQIKFKISKKDNKIEIQQLVDNKEFYFNSFEINNILKPISLNDKIYNNWLGEYKISPKIVSEHRGEELEVKYTIKIDSENHAILNIESTHHEDRFCQGDHVLIKENDILHAIGKCNETDVDNFYLKSDNDKYFIKSRRFVNEDWQELKKIK